jgi:hypothetical protein
MRIVDPLAQSFYIEPETGVYATSVDLYFYSKDTSLPVTIQLRPMQLGLPTQEVYPFSEVVLDPSDILISDDATVPTRVFFDSPVYLAGGKFHSIVILSNSNNYNVWISRLGEVDVQTANAPEAQQVLVSKNPLSGGLFKSQNADTWTEDGYEDLKFTLYRANFIQNTGSINFYNSDLNVGNDQIPILLPNSLEMSSKTIRVGLGTTVQDSGLQFGNTIIQLGSNATGNYVGAAGSATGTLSITNSGIGYTPSSGQLTYTGVALTSITGNGRDATANITINNGVAIAATINVGGYGYSGGDVLSVTQIGSESLGRNLRLSLVGIAGTNELIIDNVQGDFQTGAGKTVQYINSSGITTDLNSSIGGGVIIPADGIRTISDGLHIKVNHKNHGMHASENTVIINNVSSDVKPVRLTSDYSSSATTEIFVENTTNFTTFENVGVGSTNPGYVLIGQEIISYEGTTATSLTNITRQIDQTSAASYTTGSSVMKYELNGISLRRINKSHDFQDVSITDPIGLDYYNIKIDTTQDGKTDPLPNGQVDRSVGTSFPKLFINETKSTGGSQITATQNIQYEILKPVVQTQVLNGTTLKSRIRTVSGTSVDGSETSFQDQGFEEISLNSNNFLDSPRLVCSKQNETNLLTTLPGNKSFTLTLDLATTNSYLSPMIDMDRMGMIFVSNRVDNKVTNYATDDRVATLESDPSSFVYATKSIGLETPATSIKVLVAAYVNTSSDLRALYSIQSDPNEDPIFYPFPGYLNKNNLGQTIDDSLSDGTSDIKVPKTDALGYESDELVFKDYEFTVENLPEFRYFSIKLVGSSTNQAFPPRLRDLRVIAVA